MAKSVYVLLFRGINVGGNKIVRMELLRKMLAELGFENVATYIQSGNVVLTSDKAAAEVTKAIEGAFPQAFGFSSRPTVRSLAEWQRVIDEDPFAQVRGERSEEHTSELQSQSNLVCRLLLETASAEIYYLSLHAALPICRYLHSERQCRAHFRQGRGGGDEGDRGRVPAGLRLLVAADRPVTRRVAARDRRGPVRAGARRKIGRAHV